MVTQQSTESIQHQEKFARQIASELPDGWELYQIHYESSWHFGEHYEKFISVFYINGERTQFFPSLASIDLLLALQEFMSQPNSGTWTYLDCEILNTGKFRFDFSYGIPPLTQETLKYRVPE